MRLATRMKMTYVVVFFVPIILLAVTFLCLGSVELKRIEERYGMENTNVRMLFDPFEMLEHMSGNLIKEIEKTIEETPEKLLDLNYLGSMDSKFGEVSSSINVIKDGDIYFSSEEAARASVMTPHREEPLVVGNPSYYLKQISFRFSDGSEGVIQVFASVDVVKEQIQGMVIKIAVSGIMVLLFVVAVTFTWLYQSIVQPLDKLKKAALNIKNGNLDFNVITDNDDEIGEVCTAFEDMRIKLKDQIEVSMQYEKDNKELISNISHDLKTPITAIKGYVEGIRDGVADTPEKMDRYIRTIYNKATDMDKLIDELFLYSKLDSNSMNYSFVKLNLRDYFEDCADEISMDLDARGIAFDYHNYVSGDTIIIADPEQLKRVINNIVGNSVKYMAARPGCIGIRINGEPEFVQVDIWDNGKGIAKKELPHIFERCYRTDASRNSSKGGSGLGLSIAKKIIEEHGGKIWANSVEGEGTTISFVLRKYKECVTYE